MKKLLIIFFIFLFLGSNAWASYCGFQPFVPPGCNNPNPVCVCDGDDCEWIYICN